MFHASSDFQIMCFSIGKDWTSRSAARAPDFSLSKNAANGPKQMDVGLPSLIGKTGSSREKAFVHTSQLVLRSALLSLESGRDGPIFSAVNKQMISRNL